jgi:hypothetical protein
VPPARSGEGLQTQVPDHVLLHTGYQVVEPLARCFGEEALADALDRLERQLHYARCSPGLLRIRCSAWASSGSVWRTLTFAMRASPYENDFVLTS